MKTLGLLVAFLVFFKQSCAFGLSRTRRSEVDVQVVSPRDFSLSFPKGRLVYLEVDVNRNYDGAGEVNFEKNETRGPIYLSADKLYLKKGDDNEGGKYRFDRVSTKPTRLKRDTTDEPLQNRESSTELIVSRFGGNRQMNLPRKRFHSPGRHHFDHHGPPHFGPPRDPPPFHQRPGHWGHGPGQNFGNHGPWDGHYNEEDFYEGHFDQKKPWHQGFDGSKDCIEEEPKKPNGVIEKPVYESPDRIDDTSPGKWGVSNGVDGSFSVGNNQGPNSLNQGYGETGSGVNPGVTEKVTSTSTVIPQIDIRFGKVDDD